MSIRDDGGRRRVPRHGPDQRLQLVRYQWGQCLLAMPSMRDFAFGQNDLTDGDCDALREHVPHQTGREATA